MAVDLAGSNDSCRVRQPDACLHPTRILTQIQGQITRMVPSFLAAFIRLGNNPLRFCFILMLVMPVFAAPPPAKESSRAATVVRADARTGRLVRRIVMEPQVLQTHVPADLEKIVDRVAGEQGVESPLVHSVIRAESNYNPYAVSPKGALGLMQLIPSTARRFGVSNAFDAEENIQGGVRYLRFLLDYYQGDYPKAIAAYNAGEAAVDKYNGIPPFPETQDYVSRVAKNLKQARQKQINTPVVAAPVESATLEEVNLETPKPIQASTGSDGKIYYRTD
jgi:Transglycosylase SLT domain